MLILNCSMKSCISFVDKISNAKHTHIKSYKHLWTRFHFVSKIDHHAYVCWPNIHNPKINIKWMPLRAPILNNSHPQALEWYKTQSKCPRNHNLKTRHCWKHQTPSRLPQMKTPNSPKPQTKLNNSFHRFLHNIIIS
jgi:hypothetical protein